VDQRGAHTATTDLHTAVCCRASVALQVKGVYPTTKSEPDAGEQVVEIGCTPPLTVGMSVTDIGLQSNDVKTGDGHAIATGGETGVRPATSSDGGPTRPSLRYDCTTK